MRARNIKPGFFSNELLGTYDPIISLLFAGLWCLADKDGILEDRPLRIKAELFPYREGLDINGYITVMELDGFLTRYEVAGVKYIQINNFAKHQSPHHTEKAKGFPKPQAAQGKEGKPVLTPLNNGEHQVPERSDSLIPDSLIPDSKPLGAAAPMMCPVEKIVALYHEHMPTNPRCKILNESRRGAIRQRWREAASANCKPFGYSNVEDGLAAWAEFFQVCAESKFLTGRAKPNPGQVPFIADIDFLFSPSGFAKCLENKYHREAA